MTTLPHQGLGARGRRVRAPGSRTAAPSLHNCRTVENMESITGFCNVACFEEFTIVVGSGAIHVSP